MDGIADISPMARACSITQTYASSDTFFALIPQSYRQYYFNVVRPLQQFYDGYVYGLHTTEGGVFSTRLYPSLCDGLANKVVGSKARFKAGSGEKDMKAINFVSHEWEPRAKFIMNCRRSANYAYGFGTSLIKLNRAFDGFLWADSCRLDDFMFDVDAEGNLTSVSCLVRAYSTTQSDLSNPNSQNSPETVSYFLVEHRYFKGKVSMQKFDLNGKSVWFKVGGRQPMVSYEVSRVWGANAQSHQLGQTQQNVSWADLPDDIQKAINRDYSWVLVGKEMSLPFKEGCLGAWLVQSQDYDGCAPNMPFGKAIGRDILTELGSYDIAVSYQNRDIHNGQGIVYRNKQTDMSDLVKTQVIGPNPATAGQVLPAGVGGASPFAPTASNVQTVEGDPNSKPFANQFELRSQDWIQTEDNILRKIAAKIHMSPKVIMATLASDGVSQKTATEVDSDDDATIDWVDTQRGIFEPIFNQVLEAVLSYYGYVGNVDVCFGSSAKSRHVLLQDLAAEKEHGWTTDEEAIRELHPDEDEEQIAKRIREAKAEKEAEQANKPLFPDLGGN